MRHTYLPRKASLPEIERRIKGNGENKRTDLSNIQLLHFVKPASPGEPKVLAGHLGEASEQLSNAGSSYVVVASGYAEGLFGFPGWRLPLERLDPLKTATQSLSPAFSGFVSNNNSSYEDGRNMITGKLLKREGAIIPVPTYTMVVMRPSSANVTKKK
jgi:hypothetical protein